MRACENVGEQSQPRVAWGENKCMGASPPGHALLASLAIQALEHFTGEPVRRIELLLLKTNLRNLISGNV